jgi:hypothetical protein
MEKKFTVVEWFVKELYEGNEIFGVSDELFEQAKEMEKEQMCNFASDYVETQCNASFDGSISVDITTEEYYNLTFKSE